MYSIYILLSQKNGKRYVGYTKKDPQARLEQHLAGCNMWTSQNGPFKLIYQESLKTKTEALKREKFLKSGQGRKWLDENL